MKKVLFIGLGGIGQRHLRNVLRVLGKDTELVALRREMSSSAEINNDLTPSTWKNKDAKYAGNVLFSANRSIHKKMLRLLKPAL